MEGSCKGIMIYGMGSNYWSFVNVHVSCKKLPNGAYRVDR